jgi:hypothetical protein
MNDDNNNVSSAGDGQDDGSNTPFIHSLLTFLYSGNLPTKGKTGSAVNTFIGRLQEMGNLEKSQVAKADMIKSVKEYTPKFVARSVASQMSAELKRHYRHGTKMVSEKVTHRLFHLLFLFLSSVWTAYSNPIARFLCITLGSNNDQEGKVGKR